MSESTSEERADAFNRSRAMILWKLRALPAVANIFEVAREPRPNILGLFRLERSCNSLLFHVGKRLRFSVGWGANQPEQSEDYA